MGLWSLNRGETCQSGISLIAFMLQRTPPSTNNKHSFSSGIKYHFGLLVKHSPLSEHHIVKLEFGSGRLNSGILLSQVKKFKYLVHNF